MKTIDLHGVRHRDVYSILEKTCMYEDTPFIVVTGHSSTMKKIVQQVALLFDLEARYWIGDDSVGRMMVVPLENR